MAWNGSETAPNPFHAGGMVRKAPARPGSPARGEPQETGRRARPSEPLQQRVPVAQKKPCGEPEQDEAAQVDRRAIHGGHHERQEEEDEPDLEEIEVPLPRDGKFGQSPCGHRTRRTVAPDIT
jgi:hypothetical protein